MSNWQFYLTYILYLAEDRLSWYAGQGFKSFVDDGFGNLLPASNELICRYIASGE